MKSSIRDAPLKGDRVKKESGEPINYSNLSCRESLLSANAEIIEQLQKRLKAKRFRVQEGDSLKLGFLRVFIQALQVQNSILKDIELGEIKTRLEALEENTPPEKREDLQALTHTYEGIC
jgi:hypothetical protein